MQKISPEEADKLLMALPQWVMDEQGRTIARTFEKDDFQQAVVFVNLVAKLAEEENHHPDMFVHNYNNVTISLSTHSAGGLTDKDFLLAAKIDGL